MLRKWQQFVEDHASEGFSNKTGELDSTVVVAVTAVNLVPIYRERWCWRRAVPGARFLLPSTAAAAGTRTGRGKKITVSFAASMTSGRIQSFPGVLPCWVPSQSPKCWTILGLHLWLWALLNRDPGNVPPSPSICLLWSVLIVSEAEFRGVILLATLDEVLISMFSIYISD